jgi:Glycine cleavage H-protein
MSTFAPSVLLIWESLYKRSGISRVMSWKLPNPRTSEFYGSYNSLERSSQKAGKKNMFGPALRLAVGPIVGRRVVSSVRIASSGQVWRVPGFTRTIVSECIRGRMRKTQGSNVNINYTAKKYTPDHEWVSLDSETLLATISITQYAQSSLGDVVFVELPKVGDEVKAGGKSSTAILNVFHDH